MEQILCLAVKRTEKTVLVCGLSFGHYGHHWDDVDNIAWSDEKEEQDELSPATETTQSRFSPADVRV